MKSIIKTLLLLIILLSLSAITSVEPTLEAYSPEIMSSDTLYKDSKIEIVQQTIYIERWSTKD